MIAIDFKSPYFTSQLITYIGNKRTLLPFLAKGFNQVQEILNKPKMVCLDGFAGSGCVSRLLKCYASTLHTNDLESYTETINKCFLSSRKDVDEKQLVKYISYLNEHRFNNVTDQRIIENLYAPKDDHHIKEGERVFYTNENARIIDNIRQNIDTLPKEYQIFCLASLLIKSSIHVNTSGVFKGFYKNKQGIGQFGGDAKNALKRICQEITLDVPILSSTKCDIKVHKKDINQLVSTLNDIDLTYYDPPYNQHPYGSNYFMLNIINDYKEPKEISEVSGIPKSWNKSAFNTRSQAEQSMEDLISKTPSKFVLISYNNEGIIPFKTFELLLQKFGEVDCLKQKYNTFRGSRNLQDRSINTEEFLWILKKK